MEAFQPTVCTWPVTYDSNMWYLKCAIQKHSFTKKKPKSLLLLDKQEAGYNTQLKTNNISWRLN